MTYHETSTHTPYDVGMLAIADRLFTDFDLPPAKAVFTAIAAARTTLREERGSLVPDPNQVERLARERLLGNAGPIHHDRSASVADAAIPRFSPPRWTVCLITDPIRNREAWRCHRA